MKFLPSTLSSRVTLMVTLSSLILTGFFSVVTWNVARLAFERQVTAEAADNAKRFASFTLGYFFYQDNLIHLESQQQAFMESPNVLYSYIVDGEGLITLGRSGLESDDLGKRHQAWEPGELPPPGTEGLTPFWVNAALEKELKGAVRAGQKISLYSIPLNCSQAYQTCASVRVAIFPESHLSILHYLTWAMFGGTLLLGVVVGSTVSVVTRRVLSKLQAISVALADSENLRAEEVAQIAEETPRDAFEVSQLKRALVRLSRALEEAATHEAVARTTQAVAHDVRKPFSLLQLVIGSLRDLKSMEQVEETLKDAIPELDSALVSVNGLLSDLMDVGAKKAALLPSAHSVFEVFEASLKECARLHPVHDLNCHFKFEHTHMLRVDSSRIQRVFSNILSNALQAIPQGRGEIFIETNQLESERVQVKISNSGSVIKAESLSHLFDAFYSAGKRGGTGLGLAIAKKWTLAHGGRIWCESFQNDEHPEGLVSFYLELPTAQEPDTRSQKAEKRLTLGFFRPGIGNSGAELFSDQDKDLEDEVHKLRKRASSSDPIRAVVLEDERLYAKGLERHLQALVETPTPQVEHVETFLAYQQAMKAEVPLLAIIDIDLSEDHVNGLDAVSWTQKTFPKGSSRPLICVHSNRHDSETLGAALKRGADLYFPKPMSLAHMLQILSRALPGGERSPQNVPDTAASPSEGARDSQEQPLRVALIEDSAIFRLSWRSTLGAEIALDDFATPTEFFETLKLRQSSGEPLWDILVTDLNLGVNEQSGDEVARELRSQGLRISLGVCSNADLNPEVRSAFDFVLEKSKIPTLAELRQLL